MKAEEEFSLTLPDDEAEKIVTYTRLLERTSEERRNRPAYFSIR
jgi:acyl carrier protein